jgi:hypothetical protein
VLPSQSNLLLVLGLVAANDESIFPWLLVRGLQIVRVAARSKGVSNQAQNGLGRSAQASRPKPVSARFGPGFLPGCFSCDFLFVCTCMWAFDIVSFAVKA